MPGENYDHDVLGIGNPDHPANTEEIEVELSELEEQQLWNQDLRIKNDEMKRQLKRLAAIEQTLSCFGTLTWQEAKEKQKILNQYLC